MKIVALLISVLIGFVIGHYLLTGVAGNYAAILISYHVYLAYLVVAANREKGFSMSIGATILTHLACVGVLVGFAYLGPHIPIFRILRLFIPALAPFEAQWLFSGSGQKAVRVAAPAAQTIQTEPVEPTAEDHEAFRQYLMQKDRRFRKHGLSIDDEFKLWLASRVRQ